MEEVILFAIACFCLGMMTGYWIFFRPFEHINEDIDEIDDSYYEAFAMLSDNLAEALKDVDKDGKSIHGGSKIHCIALISL